MKRGRPTRDMLRSIDAGELMTRTISAAESRCKELAWQLHLDCAIHIADTSMPLCYDVRWALDVAQGRRVDRRDAARIDEIADSLRGVDLPDDMRLVLTAARARLALDAGKPITLDALAALAGCPLSAVQRARTQGALGGRLRGRSVAVSAKDARAWLASRGVT